MKGVGWPAAGWTNGGFATGKGGKLETRAMILLSAADDSLSNGQGQMLRRLKLAIYSLFSMNGGESR